jgi:hypothetical protein
MPEAYESHLKPVPEVRKSDSSQVSFALGDLRMPRMSGEVYRTSGDPTKRRSSN